VRDFFWRRYDDVFADREIGQRAPYLDRSLALVNDLGQDNKEVYVTL
jgi:hypothetical protein